MKFVVTTTILIFAMFGVYFSVNRMYLIFDARKRINMLKKAQENIKKKVV